VSALDQYGELWIIASESSPLTEVKESIVKPTPLGFVNGRLQARASEYLLINNTSYAVAIQSNVHQPGRLAITSDCT